MNYTSSISTNSIAEYIYVVRGVKVMLDQGIAMLSGILTSERAIAVNIEIIRAFIQLRSIAFSVQKIENRIFIF
jgi:hypothetical protein